VQCFHYEVSKRLEAAKKLELPYDDAKANVDLNARLQAFNKVSETCVDKNMLMEFIYEQLDGPEQLFHFRRNYAGQLSTDALIQHSSWIPRTLQDTIPTDSQYSHIDWSFVD
jgi:hypothetical protein